MVSRPRLFPSKLLGSSVSVAWVTAGPGLSLILMGRSPGGTPTEASSVFAIRLPRTFCRKRSRLIATGRRSERRTGSASSGSTAPPDDVRCQCPCSGCPLRVISGHENLTQADVTQINCRTDNSGVRECGRSSVWLRLPHLPFLRRGCSASSAPESEDRRGSGRCRRTIATIAASARCRSRDIAGLSPSGASCGGPPSCDCLTETHQLGDQFLFDRTLRRRPRQSLKSGRRHRNFTFLPATP